MQTHQSAPRVYLPLVFLPGASGRAAVWEPVAQRLASRRTPILLDYPNPADVSPELVQQGLGGLLAQLLPGLPEVFDLVALSMGGALALRLLLDHPERVRRLVLVTTAGGLDMTQFGALDFRPAFRASRPLAPSWLVEDRSDFSERLGEIAHECLLVFGENDPIAPPAVGQFLQRQLPHARLEIISGATHDLEEEYPDLLASLIEAHLRG